ncbi:MAG: hypothetical protein GPOALKHO_001315 [Sodalis sp.]|nr:MAG: hypothetical protein GPOALKHO_001315 [Sodalis sp.]
MRKSGLTAKRSKLPTRSRSCSRPICRVNLKPRWWCRLNDVDLHTNDPNLVAISELVWFDVLVGGGLAMTHNDKSTYTRRDSEFGFIAIGECAEYRRSGGDHAAWMRQPRQSKNHKSNILEA